MNRGPEVIVAGAGALGLSCALVLADAGARVRVLDPGLGGPNASAVAAGMLAPGFEAVLDASARPHLDVLRAARELWPALAGRAGVALHRDGAIGVGDAARLETLAAGFEALGLAFERCSAEQVRARIPPLGATMAGGVVTPEDWRLEAADALAALRRAAEAAGVVFEARAARGREGADWLVIATGARRDLADLAPELAWLSPIKGHILRARGASWAGPAVRGPDCYAVPGANGLIIGATMEPGREDPTIDPEQVESLRRAGERLFPELAQAEVQAAVGVRAATPDGLPLAGPSVAPQVLIAAGARRNGWLLAPLVARTVSTYVTGAEPGPWAERLDPRRFGPAKREGRS